MTIDNDLLRASISWRGHPDTYTPGALGETGGRFADAFAQQLDHPALQAPFTFEYFTGLLFNGNYFDLPTLTFLVHTWFAGMGRKLLQMVVGVIFHWFEPLVSARVSVVLRGGWYSADRVTYWLAEPARVQEIVFKIPLRMRYDGQPEREHDCLLSMNLYNYPEGTPRFPESQISGPIVFSWLLDGKIVSQSDVYALGMITTSPWQTYQRNDLGEGTILMRYQQGTLVGYGIKLWFPEEAPDAEPGDGFKDSIVSALENYHAREVADNRMPPSIMATATAANGYVFANWAQGKFGAPAAY